MKTRKRYSLIFFAFFFSGFSFASEIETTPDRVVIVLGHTHTGKSTIVNDLLGHTFTKDGKEISGVQKTDKPSAKMGYIPFTGGSFTEKVEEYKTQEGGKNIILVDTPSLRRWKNSPYDENSVKEHRKLLKKYEKNSPHFILVFSVEKIMRQGGDHLVGEIHNLLRLFTQEEINRLLSEKEKRLHIVFNLFNQDSFSREMLDEIREGFYKFYMKEYNSHLGPLKRRMQDILKSKKVELPERLDEYKSLVMSDKVDQRTKTALTSLWFEKESCVLAQVLNSMLDWRYTFTWDPLDSESFEKSRMKKLFFSHIL